MIRGCICALLSFAGVAHPLSAESFTGEAAVIAKARASSNAAIALHNATLVASFLADDIHVTSGSGLGLDGREAVRKKLATQFGRMPDLIYLRTPTRIEISGVHPLAAEHGTWTGHWTDAGKSVDAHGEYLAMWRKTESTWLIRAELFITLGRRENGVPVHPNAAEPAMRPRVQ